MNQHLVIVLPMAGWGTRMRPHTWNKPKALCRTAGGTTLDYIFRQFAPLHDHYQSIDYVLILNSPDHHAQIDAYLQQHIQPQTTELNIHYVFQQVMNGQSPAIFLAKEFLTGPMILAFADTLIDTDFSLITREPATAIAWGVHVAEPQHYGVAALDEQGWVRHVKEKPQQYIGSLAMVGTYYFPSGEQVVSSIERQIARGIHKDEEDPQDANGKEFFIVPAINLMIKEDGLRMRVEETSAMYDAGRPQTMLETSQYLLEKYPPQTIEELRARFGEDVVLHAPLFIADNVQIKNAVVGPNASIAGNTVIEDAKISHSILGESCIVQQVNLKNSLLGDRVAVRGISTGEYSLNLGDDAAFEQFAVDAAAETVVRCHSGAAYAEKPTALFWEGSWLDVTTILTRWRSQQGRGFRVRTADSRQFTLLYDETTDTWQIAEYVGS